MNKRPLLSLRRSPLPAQPGLSFLDAAFVTVLFAVAAASFLQVPIHTLNPFHVAAAAPVVPARIVVWVQPAGELDVNGEAVDAATLTPRLRELVGLNPGLPVEVISRGPVEAGALALALNAAKQAGAAGVQVTQLDPAAVSVTLSAAGAVLLADRG